MRIFWKSAAERDELVQELNKATKRRKTLQRDRLRVVLLAGLRRAQSSRDGDENGRELFREQIATRTKRSRQFVDQWVGRYRRGGLKAIGAKKQPGREPKLTPEQEQKLKARLDAGPRPGDKVCALRGRDIRRIIEAEFGVVYTTNGIYDVLKRLDYSSLKPRPRHRKNDPVKAAEFEQSAPFLRRP